MNKLTTQTSLDKALQTLNRYHNNKTKRFTIDHAYGTNNLRFGNEGTEKDISLGNTKDELLYQIYTAINIIHVIEDEQN